MIYFHGGVRDLEVGDAILPPAETGAPSGADITAPGAGVPRRDRVYLAHELHEAAVYAGIHEGDLYQVEAVGHVSEDQPGVSVSCSCAYVTRVIRRRVPREEAMLAMLSTIVHEPSEAFA